MSTTVHHISLRLAKEQSLFPLTQSLWVVKVDIVTYTEEEYEYTVVLKLYILDIL